MNISAGKLRNRITINAATTASDANGLPVSTNGPLFSCWASVTAITGKEVYAIGGYVSEASHKVVIRYPAVLPTHGMTVSLDSRTLTIQAVTDLDGLRRELDLYVLEDS